MRVDLPRRIALRSLSMISVGTHESIEWHCSQGSAQAFLRLMPVPKQLPHEVTRRVLLSTSMSGERGALMESRFSLSIEYFRTSASAVLMSPPSRFHTRRTRTDDLRPPKQRLHCSATSAHAARALVAQVCLLAVGPGCMAETASHLQSMRAWT